MRYIQYFENDLNGKRVEALGSDAVYIVDGRYKIDTIIDIVIERARKQYEAYKTNSEDNPVRYCPQTHIGFTIFKNKERRFNGGRQESTFIALEPYINKL